LIALNYVFRLSRRGIDQFIDKRIGSTSPRSAPRHFCFRVWR